MINQRDIDELKQIDVRAIAEKLPLPLSGKGSEWVGPCPVCGGVDRFHVKQGSFFCREVQGHCGVKGDGIKLVQLVKGYNFRQACDWLRNMANLPTPANALPMRPTKTPAAAPDWKSAEWQSEATKYVARRVEVLPLADVATAYLHDRGLSDETIQAYQLGYTGKAWYDKAHPEETAIVIPWRDGDLITCVKWRFLQPPGNKRYGEAKFPPNSSGSTGEAVLFKPPVRQSKTLAIVEGEINAMSIYQSSDFYPVSSGSKDFRQSTMEALVALAPQFDRVLIWTDERDTVKKIQAAIAHPQVTPFCSPDQQGVKLDANKLLQAGLLGDLLAKVMGGATPPPVRLGCTAAPQKRLPAYIPPHYSGAWLEALRAADDSSDPVKRNAGALVKACIAGAPINRPSFDKAISALNLGSKIFWSELPQEQTA